MKCNKLFQVDLLVPTVVQGFIVQVYSHKTVDTSGIYFEVVYLVNQDDFVRYEDPLGLVKVGFCNSFKVLNKNKHKVWHRELNINIIYRIIESVVFYLVKKWFMYVHIHHHNSYCTIAKLQHRLVFGKNVEVEEIPLCRGFLLYYDFCSIKDKVFCTLELIAVHIYC